MTRRRASRTRCGRRRGDEGSATVEVAVVLPAVLAVLALGLGAVQIAAQQVRLTDAAADAARALARGEPAGSAADLARRHVASARLSSSTNGDLICANLTASAAGLGESLRIPLSATGCARGGGL